MITPMLWKITCMEDDWPGLWHRWIRHQCVTVGYSPTWGYKLVGGKTKGERDWIKARNALADIEIGDVIVAALPGRRIGRLGEVIRKEIDEDRWNPIVPPSHDNADGEMGRRISIRWDLENSPDDLNDVVQLPEGFNLGRGTLTRVYRKPLRWFREVMANPANWVGLLGRFGYERALSDYIALYPHRLEAGMLAHPGTKIRERILSDRTRLDVLLIDRAGKPVIVECKQDSPTVDAIRQLRHYIRLMTKETGERSRGIIVHGGARKLHRSVWHEARKSPRVEIIQYKLDVDFAPSY